MYLLDLVGTCTAVAAVGCQPAGQKLTVSGRVSCRVVRAVSAPPTTPPCPDRSDKLRRVGGDPGHMVVCNRVVVCSASGAGRDWPTRLGDGRPRWRRCALGALLAPSACQRWQSCGLGAATQSPQTVANLVAMWPPRCVCVLWLCLGLRARPTLTHAITISFVSSEIPPSDTT